MQNPAILQVKILAGNFASPDLANQLVVSGECLQNICQPKYPSESAVLFYWQMVSPTFYSKGRRTQ